MASEVPVCWSKYTTQNTFKNVLSCVPDVGDCGCISIPRNFFVALQHVANRRRQRCQRFACDVIVALAITVGVEPAAITKDKDGSTATES